MLLLISKLMNRIRLLLLLAIAAAFLQCRRQPDTLFTRMEPSHTGVRFANTIQHTEQLNIFNYRNFYNGGGVGIADINNDGLPDVYLTSNMGSNKLYLNKGNFTFEDITETAGVGLPDHWSTGVVMVDINGDNLIDLYVCNAGYTKGKDQKNALFINNGDLTFTNKAEAYRLDDNGYTTHAAFLDYDGDGDLDVYILNNSFIPINTLNYSNKRELKAADWPVSDFLKGGGDKLLRNDNGVFSDVTEQAGIYQSLIGFGLGVTVGDVNADGWDDLYISNDFYEKDYLYLNNQNGTFTECMEQFFEHISHSSMGADLCDVNNDGRPDLFVTDMMPRSDFRLKTTSSYDDPNLRTLKEQQGFYHQFMHNTLQINSTCGFKDVSFHTGTAATDWSWGALLFDMDNNGLSDIYVCNGVYNDVINLDFMDFFASEIYQKMAISGNKKDITEIISKMPSQPLENAAFLNHGNLEFEYASKALGFDLPTFSNGASWADLDGDGDLDLVVNNLNQECLIYKNNTTNRGLRIRLHGPAPNTQAVGACITLHTQHGIQWRQINPSRGFQSSVDYTAVFGLGTAGVADSVTVRWPDQSVTTTPIPPNTDALDLHHQKVLPQVTPTAPPMLGSVRHPFGAHIDDKYIDFYHERGLHRRVSREGPKACVADANGDGLDDVFICGGPGQPGSLFLQSTKGFIPASVPTFKADKDFEDTACAWIDIDADGDLDLVVGSGGNHQDPNSPALADRIYRNDGSGNLSRIGGFSPGIAMNTSAIVAWDFDEDGDDDLLIFSRSVPRHYGFMPVHFLYENTGDGGLKDITMTHAGGFKGLGMVTGATLLDANGDGKNDRLVLVGEWMAPVIYQALGGKLVALPSNLSDYPGMYFSVAAADLNADGLPDLVFGNMGTNSYLSARPQYPLKLWINDFDDNKSAEKIITRVQDGKDMPLYLRSDMANMVQSIKKSSMKHAEYARKSIQELFGHDAMKRASHRMCSTSTSFVALSTPSGAFQILPLPVEAQLSSVRAILPADVNGDGHTDLLLAGNDFDLIPQFSRLDALFGALLLNDGTGRLRFIPEYRSGICIKGMTRDIQTLRIGKDPHFLFLVNDNPPHLLNINP